VAEKDVKRRLAAIFSADVKEYSRLMRDDEVATVNTLNDYRELMKKLVKQHHGRVVDSPGDNLLAEFSSVVDAVQSAVAVQKELMARNVALPDDRKMEFRIGINLGDVIVDKDGIYGDGVNIAARLEGLANPGGICISRTAYDQIEDKLPFGYEYLGEKTVKNISKPVRAYRVVIESDEITPKVGKEPSHDRRVRHRKAIEKKKAREERHKEKERKKEIRLEERGVSPRIKRKNGFSRHLRAYVGVMGLLLIINILTYTSSNRIWFQWPALGWGLGLYFHWFHGRKAVKVKQQGRTMSGFRRHLGTYVGVIGFLLIINIFTYTSTNRIWFQWPALVWGLFLFFHWQVFAPRSSKKDQ
jgi:class 3 adenylate cyclase